MGFDPSREGQLTEDKLKWGYWWVTHKVQVRRNFAIFLAIVDALLVGYAGFGYADWFFGSGVRERAQIDQMAASVIPYEFFRQQDAPRDIAVGSPIVLTAGERAYDIIAEVSNANTQWWLEFEYRFVASNVETQAKKGFLLPGETKHLHALGLRADSRPGSPELVIENVAWYRVNLHDVRPDYPSWAAARLNFLLSNLSYAPPKPTDPLKVNRATFTVTNDTGFGYYNVGFFVTLLSGTKIVAANYVVISELRAGDRRQVDASWFHDLSGVTKVQAVPDLNIFDDRVYIPPGR